MAIVVKGLTRRIVAPVFAGSIPVSRPIMTHEDQTKSLVFFLFPAPKSKKTVTFVSMN